MTDSTLTAKSLYHRLEPKRRTFLDRARACATLTIPSLMPPEGHSASSTLATPFQSMGARGTNNLASKLLLTLLPPSAPFFRLSIPEADLAAITAVGQDAKSEIEESLAQIEREVQREIEAAAIRVPAFEALKHLVVTGNALCFLDDDNTMRVFHLDQYVVERDPMGNVLTIITRELVAPVALPESMREMVEAKLRLNQAQGELGRDNSVELFTKVCREGADKFEVYQECMGMEVPDSRGYYKASELPYIALRFNFISGEDYGRGHVEEYLGDLQSLEGLAQAIVEGSAAAARVLFLVNPNGSTRQRKLAEAPNGAFIDGNEEDVHALQLEKFNDFRVAADTAEKLKSELAFAFLLNTAVQRDGERVTAEEIRYMAGELEDTLGGVYSILSQEFQLPLVQRIMAQMARAKLIPKIPKRVRPAVVTGIEALGRGHDLNRLQISLAALADKIGPQALPQYLHIDELVRRVFTAAGVEQRGLVKSKEELAQEAQQQQAAALVDKLGPNFVNKAGDILKDQTAAPAAPQS